MNDRGKRIISIVLTAFIIIGCVPIRSSAISDKKLMDKYNNWLFDNRGGIWKICTTDIDRNGTSDAIVAESLFGRVMVLTYDKEKKEVLEPVYIEWQTSKAWIGLKPQNKKFFVRIKTSGGSETTFFRMSNGKVKKLKTAEYSNGKKGKKGYKINGKRVKKAKYKNLFKGYYLHTYKR